MRSLVISILLAMAMTVAPILSPSSSEVEASGYQSPTRGAGPELNFTYLDHDAVSFGSTAFRVYDEDLVIFIEAFPNQTACDWDPESIREADIIIQNHHGHNSHYDADECATVALNTGAFVVGNSNLKSDMTRRGLPSSQIIELSPTMGGSMSKTITSLNVRITAYGMDHTFMSGTKVDTYLVEMPNGIVWYHGTCSSGSNTMNYMSGYSELKGIDVMIADTDMNFGTLNNNYYPETLIKDHDFNSAPPIPATVYEKYATVFKTLNHNDTYHYIRPDYQPELITPLVSPDSGDPSTEFDFSVLYKYRLDKAPESARIIIDNTSYNMTTTATEGWRTGAKYQFSALLMPGQVDYHFEFKVDGKMVRLPSENEFQGPPVNAPPQLMDGVVTPEEGDDDTEYTFSVKFMDSDGEPAIERYLIIDGERKGMSTQGGNPNEGVVYSYIIALQIGVHEYHFEFSDGKNQVRLPAEGEFQGPDVVRANYAPVLLQNEYEPSVGYRDTNFKFTVKYRDSHGDQPSKTDVIIDGEAFPMTMMGTKYQSGETFIYETLLEMGDHEYHFEFTEGDFAVRFPETGEFEGPVVQNRAPQVIISHPSPFGEFADDETILLDASNSTDPDGDEITFSWSSDIDGQLATGITSYVTLSEGQHLITLTVDDGLGEQDTAKINVIITHYEARLNLECSIKPTYPREDNEITATATISNSGNIASEGYNIAFYLDGDLLVDQTLPSLVAGRSKDVSHSFRTAPGTHSLKVIIQDGYIAYFNFTTTERTPPLAMAGEDQTVFVGDQVTFDGSNSQIVGTPRLMIWDFGDDMNQTGWTVSHIYFKPGVYNVTLTVVDDLGKTSTATVEVTVLEVVDDDTDPIDDEGSISTVVIIGFSLGFLVIAVGLLIGGFVIIKKKDQAGMQTGHSSQVQPVQQQALQTGNVPIHQGQAGQGVYQPPLPPPTGENHRVSRLEK